MAGPTAPAAAKREVYPALDGLRAILFAAVFAAHGEPRIAPGANQSLEFFFVISGFLITNVLLHDRAQTGGTSFRNFYIRRIQRLFPALVTVMIGVWLIYLFDSSTRGSGSSLLSFLGVIFYFGNWLEANKEGTLSLLSQTWTLSVEEQFYALWPILFFLFMRKGRVRALLIFTAVVAVASALWRMVLWASTHDTSVYYRSDTRASAMFVGCGLALVFNNPGWRARVMWLNRTAFSAFALAAWALMVLTQHAHSSFSNYFGDSFSAVLSVFLIVHLTTKDSWINRLLSIPILLWVGRRSYGLYLIHVPVIFYLHHTKLQVVGSNGGAANTAIVFVIEAIITAVLGALMYKYIERPFLRRPLKSIPGRPPGGDEVRPVPA